MIWQAFKALSLDKQAAIVIPALGMIVWAGWTLYTYFANKPVTPQNPTAPITINDSISVDNGATQVISTGAGNVTINTRDPQDKKI